MNGFLVSVLVLLVGISAQAQEDSIYQALYQEFKVDFKRDPIHEVPNGLNPKPQRPPCDLKQLENFILRERFSNAEYYKVVKAYFAKCGDELSANSIGGLPALIQFATYKYPFLSHPQVQRITITLENGRKVHGALALRADASPRPFVIYRCGVLCATSESASTRAYLMYLFDQSPFNVLILGNQTGLDYIESNKMISMAGVAEGQEIMDVGKWLLQKWQYKARISSLHFMAVSLGGNGAIHSAALNDVDLLENGQKVFNSIAAICPAIDFQASIDKLFKSPKLGLIFTKLTRDHFQKSGEYVTDVPELLTNSSLPLSPFAMPDFVGKVAATSLNRRGISSTPEMFFEANNFLKFKTPLRTPLFVWASKDDWIVNNEVNTQILERDPEIQNSEYVGVVNLPYGNHCGFSSVYGMATTATVLRDFVLVNSPEFVSQYLQMNELDWNFGGIPAMSRYEHYEQDWKFTANSSKVNVTFKLVNRKTLGCDPEVKKLPLFCLSEKQFTIPIESLLKAGARVPDSDVEAQVLTREFNTKMEILSESGALNGTNIGARKMRWSSAF